MADFVSLKPLVEKRLSETLAPREITPGLKVDDIVNDPAKFDPILKYMVRRNGTQYYQKPKEEVVDDFVSHMRWVGTNELSTVGEARYVYSLSDEDKMATGEAYKTYDQLGNVFVNDGVGGALGGLWDYTKATFTAPSTYVGNIVGRLATRPARKAIEKTMLDSIVDASVKGTKSVLKDKATKETAIEVAAIAMKRNMTKLVATATAADAFTSVASDALYQNVMIETGAQEQHSMLQSAFATLGGAVGGVVSYIPESRKTLTALTGTAGKIEKARELRAQTAIKRAAPKIKAALQKVTKNWETLAQEGQALDANSFTRSEALDWFVNIDREDGFVRILQEAGADLNVEDAGRFSHQLADFALSMPKEFAEEMDDTLQPLGINYTEFVAIFARASREAGQTGNKLSIAAKFYNEYKNVTVSKTKAIKNILSKEVEEGLENEIADKSTLGYITDLWKRTIVSHLATTALNVKGWGISMRARTLAEIVHGGTLGAVGMTRYLMGSTELGARNLAQSAALMENQMFMIRSGLSPYTTVESFYDMLSHTPKKIQKQATEAFFGGIRDRGPEAFGLNPDSKVLKATEFYADKAAKMSFIKAQDVYTKAISGMKELDKQSRLKFGVGIEELVDQGRTHELDEDMWQSAVDALLRDTYSQDYTKEGSLKRVAKLVEQVSSTPGVGFIFPFGRFMNNSAAFIMRYSPLGIMEVLLKAYKTKNLDIDLGDKLSRGIVGTTALGMLALNEKEKSERGLQWYEQEDSKGQITNVQNMFPLSFYNLAGRIAYKWASGEGVSEDLGRDLIRQIGIASSLQTLSNNSLFQDLSSFVTSIQEESFSTNLGEGALSVLSAAAGIAAGYTRPFDFANDTLGAISDTYGITSDTAIDRRQATGIDATIQNLTRYTNNFFSFLIGEEKEDVPGRMYGEPLNYATKDKPVRDPNPLSTSLGRREEAPKTNIDLLLAQVDIAPFKANEFSSGDPEYDAFINNRIFPILEKKATNLINSKYYKQAPEFVKRDLVKKILSEAREEILSLIDDPYLFDSDDRLINERSKFLKLPASDRVMAKKALGITAKDRELNMFQLQLLRDFMNARDKIEKEYMKGM